MKTSKVLAFTLSLAVATLALFVPNWKSINAAESYHYRTPLYLIDGTMTVEKANIKQCGKNGDFYFGSTITIFDDNSVDIRLNTDTPVTLTGSWYRTGNNISILLDGSMNMAYGNTGSIGVVLEKINEFAKAVCSDKNVTFTHVLEPTVKVKSRLKLYNNEQAAKLSMTYKGLMLTDLNNTDTTVKSTYKLQMIGGVTKIQ